MTAVATIIGAIIVAILLFLILSRSRRSDDLTRIGARLDELTEQLNGRLRETMTAMFALTQQVNDRLRDAVAATERGQDRTSEALGTFATQLGEHREALNRLVELQRELRKFQELLQPPKARGGVGERLLEQILADIIPHHYEAQYLFRSGERVDFILRLKDFIVPIDAKFPLESFERLAAAETDEERSRAESDFRRTLKQHIDAVARKYIRPDEGTSEFAFLYIPSEAVYLAFAKDAELMDYAFDRRVVVVSPGTFFAYLRTILVGLKGFAIEARAKELLASLASLEGELATVAERFRLSGRHLRDASRSFEEAERHLTRLTERLRSWAGSTEKNERNVSKDPTP
jgi:DNA recombination protein RmuC